METAVRTDRPGLADLPADVSWASIVTGAIVTAALSLALLALGAGLGLAAVEYHRGLFANGSDYVLSNQGIISLAVALQMVGYSHE